MPFTKHIIEPINIAQCPIPTGEPNELECLSNLTLANVIRQLSSLGQHAGRLFDELVQDALKCQSRLQLLDARIQTLRGKCEQLDIQNEEVSVDDAKNKKQFTSSVKLDQQVVSRRTMPDSIRLLYEQADPPPSLDKLNPYRSDGKDCMKFYTDPGFFFNIWCNELMKDNETRKMEKKKRKSRGDKQTPKSGATSVPGQYADPTGMGAQKQQLTYPESPRAMTGPGGVPLNYPYNNNVHYAQQQQAIYAKSPPNAVPGGGYYINNDQEDMTGGANGDLPPPPPPAPPLQQLHHQSSMEIYAESSRFNNGTRAAKMNMQQASKSHYAPTGIMSERPHLPPPPIPTADAHLSDLQEMQQQIIRKFDVLALASSSSSSNRGGSAEPADADLPPPPPPMHFDGQSSSAPIVDSSNGGIYNHHHHQFAHPKLPGASGAMLNHHHHHHSMNNHHNDDLSANEMPLPPPPPPPIDLTQTTSGATTIINNVSMSTSQANTASSNAAPLPPPPPLPPLVEPDTTSSSNSSLSASATTPAANQSTTTTTTTAANKSLAGTQSVGRSFLDDINKGRFVLKPTQKESLEERQKKSTSTPTTNDENGRDTIQPFVNNSDVAAIIDFVRKYRPHVCESSDDEENSDWDE